MNDEIITRESDQDQGSGGAAPATSEPAAPEAASAQQDREQEQAQQDKENEAAAVDKAAAAPLPVAEDAAEVAPRAEGETDDEYAARTGQAIQSV